MTRAALALSLLLISTAADAAIVSPLANKVYEIKRACPNTKVISAVRKTRIAGTGRMSLHAYGKAVDVRGNYRCIYSQLRGWAGGYSTDAGRVKHIHISYDAQGGREMGVRFRHGVRKTHYARRPVANHHRVRVAAR
jgi:hypothetical protein